MQLASSQLAGDYGKLNTKVTYAKTPAMDFGLAVCIFQAKHRAAFLVFTCKVRRLKDPAFSVRHPAGERKVLGNRQNATSSR